MEDQQPDIFQKRRGRKKVHQEQKLENVTSEEKVKTYSVEQNKINKFRKTRGSTETATYRVGDVEEC